MSDHSFNNCKSWVDDAIRLNHGPNESTFESATRVPNHLIRFYKDSFFTNAIAKQMTVTQYVAMLSALGISGKKEIEWAKYLRHHLGKSFILPRIDVWSLGEGHATVNASIMQWEYQKGKKPETVCSCRRRILTWRLKFN